MSSSASARQDPLAAYVAEVNRYPQLPANEEEVLARRWRDTKDMRAAHALVTANLRFVVKVALEYRAYGLRVLDLIQEGNVGLVIAVSRFDPDRSVRLISYAVWWIRAYIQSFILRSWSLVKIGTTRAQRKLFFKMRRERRRLRNNGEDPEAATLAEALGVKTVEVEEMEQRLAGRDLSLDTPRDPDSGKSLTDQLISSNTNQEDRLAAREEHKDVRLRLKSGLAALDPRERAIIERRYLRDRPATLAELGEEYGVSRERIRQIEERAKRKLRERLQGVLVCPEPDPEDPDELELPMAM
jgi:RNA polymerase sigma-32 factor